MSTEQSMGRRLVRAIAAKDRDALHDLLDPAVDFRAMTPRRFWEGRTPDDVGAALSHWFDDGDDIRAVEKVDVECFADVEHVSYRLHVLSGGRPHVVGQQAYLSGTADGRIGWLRIMCAGFRPSVPTSEPSTHLPGGTS